MLTTFDYINTCMCRFNYMMLGGYEGRSRLVTIEDKRNETGVREMSQ